MKRFTLTALCGLIAVAVCASDIYDLKFTCRGTGIKGSSAFYKDLETRTFRGFIDLSYSDNGEASLECPVILYGPFQDGKGTQASTLSFAVLQRFGKRMDRSEVLASAEFDKFAVTLAGFGDAKVSKATATCPTTAECASAVRVDSASGTLTGWMAGVVCVECNEFPYSYWLNCCADAVLAPQYTDAVMGTWAIKYNKTLSKKASETSFEEAVMSRIPSAYLAE